MHIDDALYNELIEYLARKPWHEVNKLINKLARAARPNVEYPSTLKETPHGHNES